MKILLPSLLLFFATFFGCKNDVCPPDEKVGDLALKSTSLAFVPYTGSEKLIFKNGMGDSLTLAATEGKQIAQDQLCVKKLCTEPKIKGNSTCEYFSSESNRYIFSNAAQTVLIDLLLTSDVFGEDTQNFYSFLRLGVSFDTYISQAGIITEVQFNGHFDEAESSVNNFFREQNMITLNGKTFENVLAYEADLIKYYYSKSEGLVGMQTPDATWHLDRVE